MAAVIKQAAETGGVRSLATPVRVATMPVDPREEELAALRAQVERLAAKLAEAGRAATTARDDAAAAIADARAEGRRAGLAAAETREDDRVAAIGEGITAEWQRFAKRLETLNGLAAALARACLDRVFARPEAMATMVVAALERRLGVLRDESMLDIRVSGADFSDTAALDAAVRAAGARATVAIDLDLPAGGCRIAARLGRIDLDVPAQWADLAQVLDGMAGA